MNPLRPIHLSNITVGLSTAGKQLFVLYSIQKIINHSQYASHTVTSPRMRQYLPPSAPRSIPWICNGLQNPSLEPVQNLIVTESYAHAFFAALFDVLARKPSYRCLGAHLDRDACLKEVYTNSHREIRRLRKGAMQLRYHDMPVVVWQNFVCSCYQNYLGHAYTPLPEATFDTTLNVDSYQ
ncbi:hypothetical protein M501DRAFT_999685 [Patellaria atrata CBS 101060]|uniref:Uncharacterized protein n=1 Tax=Patellaria atrata CBS 101060 TaxID=1346257 RepID=A0A9P4VNW9_9PEZI|nr:hypothetical protein M501DRAFT_999685 [Patellaria atrata CBS 101060]